jgi:hypothetical protein
MGTLGLVLFIVLFAGCISWAWVRGIDYMKENHPDYKGEDFLNWDLDSDVTKIAGRDGWDDNLVHTEGDF